MEQNARLRRLLYLVPAVLRRDGVPLRELAEELSVDEQTVREDIELLSMVGPPAGGPDEFLLLTIDEDDRVYADLPQGLTRPLRLTAAEAFSLTLGLRALAGSGLRPYEDAVARLLTKVRAALGEASPGLAALERQSIIDGAGEGHSKLGLIGDLHRAVGAHQPVEIVYHSASRGLTETRGVDPYALVNHRGAWYLVGRCHHHDEPRLFKIERVSAVHLLDGRFEVPASFDLEQFRRDNLFQPSPAYPTVRLRFDPPLGYEVRTRFDPGQIHAAPDGSLEVTMENPISAWLVNWVLGFGPSVQVLDPPELRQAVVKQARALAELHQ